MKKIFSMMAVLAAMFAFVACTETGDGTDEPNNGGGTGDGSQLATPELSIKEQTETSFIVAWNAVSGADSYMVNLDGKNYTTAECEYKFENLNAGKYTVRVKAKGEGYKDSENGKIEVELTGITSADWFTQELIAVTETTELNDGTIVQPWNALFFNWKGTGIKTIKYGMFTTADVEGVSPATIKENLTDYSEDAVLAAINSAEGLTSCFNGLNGGTSYTLYALVTNADGIEYLTSSTLSTAEAQVSDDTKKWLGNFSAQTAQVVEIDDTTIVKDQVTDFTFNVSIIEGTADEVWVDGISVMGTDCPAQGMVAPDENGNVLMAIWNFSYLGEWSEGIYAVYYAFCYIPSYSDYYFVSGDYPAYILTMAADGTITCEGYTGQLSDGSEFTVVACDIAGIDANGKLAGLFQAEDGSTFNTWKFGDWTNIQKTESAPAALSAKANVAGVVAVPASVVVAM